MAQLRHRDIVAPVRPSAGDELPTISGHHDAPDGVRAVAALAVLLFHVAASTGYPSRTAGATSLLLSRRVTFRYPRH